MGAYISGSQILLENGCSVESMINGIVKNLDIVKIPPISGILGDMVPDFVEGNAISLNGISYFLARSDTFKVEDDIIKDADAYHIHKYLEVTGEIQFNTVNESGEEIETYLIFVPRYYLREDYDTPTRWGTHAIHMSLKIPTGTRRWVMPIFDTYNFGRNTTGIDFMLYPAGDHEGLTYTVTRRCSFSARAYSSQYQ